MGENLADIEVQYGVVSEVMETMGELATSAAALKQGLAGLESDINTYYKSDETPTIIQNYDDFMQQIETIKGDIDSVNEWCQLVSSTMSQVEAANAEEMKARTLLA